VQTVSSFARHFEAKPVEAKPVGRKAQATASIRHEKLMQ
jgi:hypothetical protein